MTPEGTASTVRRPDRVLVVVVAVALVLRCLRLVNRWDEVALAYAAYAAPASERLWAGSPGEAMACWVGLHPPAHALLLAVLDGVWPAPAAWMGLSILFSVLAVWMVGRAAGPWAALVLATSPVQLMDAAEVNNYPLAVAGLAALLWARKASWPWFVAAVVWASYGHVLGLCVAGGLTASRLVRPVCPRERIPLGVGAALVAAPLVAGILRLSLQSSTFSQADFEWFEWVAMVGRTVGPEAALLAVLAFIGLFLGRSAPVVGLLVLGAAYLAALQLGAAAAHQRPYLSLFGPPVAVAVGAGLMVLRARWHRTGTAVVVLFGLAMTGRALRCLRAEWSIVTDLRHDLQEQRGVDVALAESRTGDVIWLVAPALQADDDKTDHSSVLWRFSPFRPMPRAAIPGVAFDYTDWLWGQPREMNGRTVHTSTELDPGRFDRVVQAHHQAGREVWVILYDHAPAAGLLERIQRTVRIYTAEHLEVERNHGLGNDHVWRIPGGGPDARP